MKKILAYILAGIGLCLSVLAGPAVYGQVAQQHCCSAFALGGVTSLNALTGALNLISSDSSVSITPSGTNIDLKAAGGSASTYRSYDQMVESDHPTIYVPLADPTASPGASETQFGFVFPPTGTPGAGATSLISNGDQATSFASTGNYYTSPVQMGQSGSINFSAEMWLEYPSVLPSATSAPLSMDTTGNNLIELRVSPAGVVHVVFQGVADEATSLTVTAGTPYFLCLVYNGGGNAGPSSGFWNLYENNGVSVGSGTDSMNGGDVFARIGSGFYGGQGVVMQKVAVYYGEALPLSRCKAHYVGGSTGAYE